MLAGSGAPVQLPPPGSSVALPPMPNVPLTVNLARNATHVLITTQPGYAEQWLAGTGGGFATSPAAAGALAAANDGAPLIMGASDTPRLATTGKTLLMTFGAFMPPEPLAALQALLTTIEQRGGPGYMVLETTSDGGRFESKGLIGGMTLLPMIGAIAIPNLIESREAANRSAAMATLRSAIMPAQVQAQAGAYRDGDGDGIGEHLLLSELSGTTGVENFPQGS